MTDWKNFTDPAIELFAMDFEQTRCQAPLRSKNRLVLLAARLVWIGPPPDRWIVLTAIPDRFPMDIQGIDSDLSRKSLGAPASLVPILAAARAEPYFVHGRGASVQARMQVDGIGPAGWMRRPACARTRRDPPQSSISEQGRLNRPGLGDIFGPSNRIICDEPKHFARDRLCVVAAASLDANRFPAPGLEGFRL